ncbi:vicilin-like antimicrobial peptides 2-2, partial [Olea europaea subsp. europaea]
LQSQHERLRILLNFAERSKLLMGIDNYRVAILEAHPQTFTVLNRMLKLSSMLPK